MKKFRLPRKIKKKLRKTIYLYPYDENLKGYKMAFAYKYEEDYIAFKKGILRDILE